MIKERELIEVETQETIFERDTPWQDVGVDIESGSSVDDMINKAGLDWEVFTRPCFAQLNGSNKLEIGKQALIRESDGKLLDIISDEWRPMQNSDALEYFKDFAELCEGEISSVGTLNDGKIIWAIAKVPDMFYVQRAKDKVQAYLLFKNPHQYGQSIDIKLMAIREISKSGVMLPLNHYGNLRINHRAVFNSDIVGETVHGITEGMKTYKKMAQTLVKSKIDYDETLEYLKVWFPSAGEDDVSRNAKFILNEVLDKAPGAGLGAGTRWGLFAAVCYMIDFGLTRSVDARLSSSWYGNGQRLKLRALETLLKDA